MEGAGLRGAFAQPGGTKRPLGSRPRSKDHGSVRYSSTQRIVESPYTYFYIFNLYTKCRYPSLRICHDVRATRP
ncbi:hypothetical protein CBM2623_B30302 [Cupriavidus taiwanensis]|nr:hypothetical protein CBM2608_B30302 [Cupriavidus taiwanensis]SPA34746.1 hypothetical protein CBM2623_B30302 [Cupriavidus taiwanensis]